MAVIRSMLALFLLALLSLPTAIADGAPKDRTVEQLAESARKSVVVITVRGRDGKREGMGTGFFIGNGLIVTNQHVLGEGRSIQIETVDGMKLDVSHVHAFDRKKDLAVLRVVGADLTALPLGEPKSLKDGQAVVALGNPQGLKHSVVAGVVSGQREIDGRKMIQVAIPIEPGNSGGPLLDMQGRVHGIITIKSLVTANLGFAVTVDELRPLLAKPNSIPMKAWLTIGQLDEEDWKLLGGSSWRQRAGHIHVEGLGGGFGGRSLCLSRRDVPALPFELSVAVKLGKENGAAGLAFHADGDDKHYGFYPTAGKLRLTRFDGPDVFTWKVLREEASPHYQPGEWNTLKVRLEKDRIRCFVNDQPVFEVEEGTYSSGLIGVCKFRDTVAEFKQLRIAKELKAAATPQATTRINKALEALGPGKPRGELVDKLAPDAAASLPLLRQKARELEQQAERLKELAAAVHQKQVILELVRALEGKEEAIDLLHAALLLAKLDNDEVDVESYRAEVERMGKRITARLPKDADEKAKLAAIDAFLFAERGFHGSRGDYYNRSNSYLNEVLDDREGLPITLSVLYIELARRLGVKVEGVGLPGHFVVRHVPAKGEPRLIDVYESAAPLSRDEAAKRVQEMTGRPIREEHLAAVDKRAIVVRMLHNLLRVARDERDNDGMLRYLEAIVTLMPDAAEERGMRAALRAGAGDRDGALQDVDWLLDHMPEGLDIERLREFRRLLTRPM